MGVSRAVLPTENMDYAKPDSRVFQSEEKPDSLDKATSGLAARNTCETSMIYVTVHK